ncbi:hypothetical protein HDU98_004773, partial [Podochytrium sp. JEL0797]
MNTPTPTKKPCRDFSSPQGCRFGPRCKFSHEPTAPKAKQKKPCRDFAKGECSFGDRCKFSHTTVQPRPCAVPITAPCEPTAGPSSAAAHPSTPLVSHPPNSPTLAAPTPTTNSQDPDATEDEFGPINTLEPYILHNRLSHKLGMQTLREEAMARSPRAQPWEITPGVLVEMFARIKNYAETTHDPVAQHLLGTRLQHGHGCESDAKKAVEWYQKAVNEGSVGAMHDLAICHANGIGVPQNQKKAFALLKKAAEGGLAVSQRCVGGRYMNGHGTKRDEKLGIEWMKKAAVGGDEKAQAIVHQLLGDQAESEDSDDNASQESDQGSDHSSNYFTDPEEEFALHPGFQMPAGFPISAGMLTGGGMMTNLTELTKLMESSGMMDEMQEEMAQSGGSLSLNDLMQRFGGRFTETISKAAAEGNTTAQAQLACSYEMGSGGVPQDEKKALEYYTKAHEGGNIAATHDLALCYLRGTGVKKDAKKAVELLTQAAEAGFVLSEASLGNRYLNGEGVKKNEKVGFSWVKKAALK